MAVASPQQKVVACTNYRHAPSHGISDLLVGDSGRAFYLYYLLAITVSSPRLPLAILELGLIDRQRIGSVPCKPRLLR